MVGPNLDTAKPSAALIVSRLSKGKGAMPSFKGRLTTAQMNDIAAFITTAKH